MLTSFLKMLFPYYKTSKEFEDIYYKMAYST
jgi:hypothetical protein